MREKNKNDDVLDEKLPPTGLELIIAERERQITKEGWTAEHDDSHDVGVLAQAGGCYAIKAAEELGLSISKAYLDWPSAWPFDEEDYKPTEPIRQLVKAGALIAAEIDRLQRAK